MLYVPFNAPHSPFQAKKADMEKYADLKQSNRAYAAMVDAMDQAIGRILATVEAGPDADNTLIVFLQRQRWRRQASAAAMGNFAVKLSVYEGGTRVCAAIRWPKAGLTGGKTFDGRIGYIDVLPTLLALAGEELPKNLDGINFIPALDGKTKLPERPWFSYMDQNHNPQASVHLGDWKLVAKGDFFAGKAEDFPDVRTL